MRSVLIALLLVCFWYHFAPAQTQAPPPKPSPYAPQADNCYNLLPAPMCDVWIDSWDWLLSPPQDSYRCDLACNEATFPDGGDGDDWGVVEPDRWEDPQ